MKASNNTFYILALLAGLVLMIAPASFTSLIVLVIGAFVTASGVWSVISSIKGNSDHGVMIYGIIRALVGIYMITHKAAVLSLIPILLGIMLIVEGAAGLSITIGAAKYINIALIVIGIVLVFNPLGSVFSAVSWCGALIAGYGILGLVKTNISR